MFNLRLLSYTRAATAVSSAWGRKNRLHQQQPIVISSFSASWYWPRRHPVVIEHDQVRRAVRCMSEASRRVACDGDRWNLLTACWLTMALNFSFPGWWYMPIPRPRRTSVSFGLSVKLCWAPLEATDCWGSWRSWRKASCIAVGFPLFLALVLWDQVDTFLTRQVWGGGRGFLFSGGVSQKEVCTLTKNTFLFVICDIPSVSVCDSSLRSVCHTTHSKCFCPKWE